MAMFLARLPASRLRSALQENKGRSIPGLQNDVAFGNKEKEDSNEAGMSFQEGSIDYGFALDCGAIGSNPRTCLICQIRVRAAGEVDR
jgi:hypothetical protein